MILDKEGKIFGKVNILDFLAAVFVIAVLGFIGFKFLKTDSRAKSVEPMTVTVYVDNVQPDIAKSMQGVKQVYFGRGLVKTPVSNVQVLSMPAGSGRPDFKEVRVTLSGSGYVYSDGAYFDDQRVSLGEKVWLRSIYELETTVMKIN